MWCCSYIVILRFCCYISESYWTKTNESIQSIGLNLETSYDIILCVPGICFPPSTLCSGRKAASWRRKWSLTRSSPACSVVPPRRSSCLTSRVCRCCLRRYRGPRWLVAVIWWPRRTSSGCRTRRFSSGSASSIRPHRSFIRSWIRSTSWGPCRGLWTNR